MLDDENRPDASQSAFSFSPAVTHVKLSFDYDVIWHNLSQLTN